MELRSHLAVTLRQLLHFVTAAESGSMSEAARRLHMAPSAISMSIAELERITGAQLCIKQKSKGLTLTTSGRAVLRQAAQILELSSELVHSAQGDAASVRGPLTVGCYMPLAPSLIPSMLADFAHECPNVDVDFLEGYHDELQDKLLDGTIDVAFLYEMGLGPELQAAPVLSMVPYVLLNENHPLRDTESIELTDIADEELILYDSPPISTRVLDMFREHGLEPRVQHRSRSYATIRSLVGLSSGVGVLLHRPELEVSYAHMGVVIKPLAGLTRRSPTVALVWSRNNALNLRARRWIDVAQTRFGSELRTGELSAQPSPTFDHITTPN